MIFSQQQATRRLYFSSNSTTSGTGIPKELIAASKPEIWTQVLAIGEAASQTPSPNFMYAGSRFAITHWMRTMAAAEEWAGRGIRVNALAPGAVRTPLIDRQLANRACQSHQVVPNPSAGVR